jgi:hypothetical protein
MFSPAAAAARAVSSSFASGAQRPRPSGTARRGVRTSARRSATRVIATKATADVDADVEVDVGGPTQVPRAQGVQDGEWNALDAELVANSQADATKTYNLSLPSEGIAAAASSAAAAPFHLLGLTLAELKQFAADSGGAVQVERS